MDSRSFDVAEAFVFEPRWERESRAQFLVCFVDRETRLLSCDLEEYATTRGSKPNRNTLDRSYV